jgi:polysaccharide deacetylase family protein (PEP-CTERM system associated)
MNIITFDIEDYFQVENFKSQIAYEGWSGFDSRVGIGLERILTLLAEDGVKATFFILGWIAERHPELVKEIARAGHEVATHGYAHELIYTQTPDEFRADLRRSIDIIENISGEKVLSFRAPCFSITKDSLWALDVLLEEGIRYDSSIFPIHHDRYGIPDCDPMPHVIREKDGRVLREIPLSVARFGPLNLPYSGGGYFRLLPLWFTHYCARRTLATGAPVVVYLHPWEFDPDQPRVKTSALNSFRHYYGLKHTARKLKKLVSLYRFDSIRGVMGSDIDTITGDR